MKFKVGDVVKIIGSENGSHSKWNGTRGFNNTWACVMDSFIGKVCKVTDVTEFGIDLTGCNNYRFPPQALELYTEKVKIQKDKKYRTVKGKHPARVVCMDALGGDKCVVLYEISGTEWTVKVNEYGEYWDCKIIEEVPEVDWSKVAIDTPIWVTFLEVPVHFAEFEQGVVRYFKDGRTSHTENDKLSVPPECAKLTKTQ